jgi:hypothetical protein
MRRALARARGFRISVGKDPTGAGGESIVASTGVAYASGPTASGSGVITQVKFRANSAGTVRFFTMALTTEVVRDVEDVSVSSGIGTYSVSLTIVSGDVIGYISSSVKGYASIQSGSTFLPYSPPSGTVNPSDDLTSYASVPISNTALALLGQGN